MTVLVRFNGRASNKDSMLKEPLMQNPLNHCFENWESGQSGENVFKVAKGAGA